MKSLQARMLSTESASMASLVDVVADLVQLSAHGRRLLASLVQDGGRSATELARVLGWHRNQVYRAIEELEGHGMVVRNQDQRGARFEAMDADRMALLVESELLHGRIRAAKIDSLVPVIRSHWGRRGPPGADLRVIDGRARAMDVLAEIIVDARRSLDTVDFHAGADVHLSLLEADPRVAGRADLTKRAVLAAWAQPAPWPAGVDVRRHPATRPWRLHLVDDAVALASLRYDEAIGPQANDLYLLSTKPSLVAEMRGAFDAFWAAAKGVATQDA